MKKILAVASAGVHWTEMMNLKAVFDGHDVAFVCTMEMYRSEVAPSRSYSIPGVSRLYKRSIAKLFTTQAAVLVRLCGQKHSGAK